MILSLLKGGLGNMMFQLAAGASLSHDLNTDFVYTLDGWNCVTNYNIQNFPNTIFKNLKQVKIDSYVGKINLYREQDFSYKPLPTHGNLALDGYFQSEKYFTHNREHIKSLFDIPVDAKYKDHTFMHVRRKDYLLHSQVHPTCPVSYYKEALNVIGADKVIILSDDIDWCRKNIDIGQAEFSMSKTEIEDLSIMISCKNSIIANSTFSWWGAWLSDSDKVIAPKMWFGPQGPKNWTDIYARNWITI